MFLRMGTGENITMTYLSGFAALGVLARPRARAASAAATADVRAASLRPARGPLRRQPAEALLARRLRMPKL
jgi:hypothetical protein